MQISSLLESSEIKELQQKFYEYFETGYAFEEFLKEYLLKMGLDEVEITQRSRDGGVDLTAIRKGVGGFSDVDITHYYIQAKRYALRTKVRVPAIRELKGTIPFGYKGIMITTSDFTNDAITESSNDQSKPVVIINGKDLVTSCIDNEIGFVFKPIFSKEQMNLFVNHPVDANNAQIQALQINFIEKTITSNDIRARIVSVPTAIIKQLPEKQTKVTVLVNGDKSYHFSLSRGRNYFGGVTAFLKDYNLLSDDGVIFPRQSKWGYNSNENIVNLRLED